MPEKVDEQLGNCSLGGTSCLQPRKGQIASLFQVTFFVYRSVLYNRNAIIQNTMYIHQKLIFLPSCH